LHLEHAGYRVSEAADGREALEMLRAEPPDLLLLDMTMPDIDGWELLERASGSGQLNGVRVAVLTANADEMAEHRARKAGADAYLVKPLEPGDLTRAVERLLGS
jgi:CheY-like chemotaxis protein